MRLGQISADALEYLHGSVAADVGQREYELLAPSCPSTGLRSPACLIRRCTSLHALASQRRIK
jgi:hypothetical protein